MKLWKLPDIRERQMDRDVLQNKLKEQKGGWKT
jgi:hypothetical protein